MLRSLRSWWRQALVVVLFLLVASCSGGGCSSGCSSCGITPIAGGFAPSETITNSASVRVTKSGLEFLSANLPGLASTLLGRSGGVAGVIDFDIPQFNGTVRVMAVAWTKDADEILGKIERAKTKAKALTNHALRARPPLFRST